MNLMNNFLFNALLTLIYCLTDLIKKNSSVTDLILFNRGYFWMLRFFRLYSMISYLRFLCSALLAVIHISSSPRFLG